MSVEYQNGPIERGSRSREARENVHTDVYQIMRNQAEWDGNRSSVRGYWQNMDGSLVEIHPDLLGEPVPRPPSSSNWRANDARSDQATQQGGHWEQPCFPQEAGKTTHDQLHSTLDTVPNVEDIVDGGGDGMEIYEMQDHDDMG